MKDRIFALVHGGPGTDVYADPGDNAFRAGPRWSRAEVLTRP